MIDDNTLLADGFEGALIGFGYQHTKVIAIYDYQKCVSILMERDEMTEEEALEHMDYNVVGSYVGEYTPLFLNEELLNEYSA